MFAIQKTLLTDSQNKVAYDGHFTMNVLKLTTVSNVAQNRFKLIIKFVLNMT